MPEKKPLAERKMQPIDKTVKRTVYASIAVLALAVGAAMLFFGYLYLANTISDSLLGIGLVWIGSILFFYAIVTEEHTLKELFLRESYFFSGLLSMIIGIFFITMGGFFADFPLGIHATQFGLLIMIFGAALIILSAQKYKDYTKNNALFSAVAGILLVLGGILAQDTAIVLFGVGMLILSALWLSLRSKKAY